jgi:hypothetical protein
MPQITLIKLYFHAGKLFVYRSKITTIIAMFLSHIHGNFGSKSGIYFD